MRGSSASAARRFPTHVKLKIPEGKHVDTLIINGVECEPYLTTDHRVMLEQTEDVFAGIRYLMKLSGCEACYHRRSNRTNPTRSKLCAPALTTDPGRLRRDAAR